MTATLKKNFQEKIQEMYTGEMIAFWVVALRIVVETERYFRGANSLLHQGDDSLWTRERRWNARVKQKADTLQASTPPEGQRLYFVRRFQTIQFLMWVLFLSDGKMQACMYVHLPGEKISPEI